MLMRGYFAELYNKISTFQDQQQQLPAEKVPGTGGAGLLHISKQIAVLVELATLFAQSENTESKSPDEPERKFALFIIVMLSSGATTFSQQQIVDFKQLLDMVCEQIGTNNSCENFYLFSSLWLDKIDMSLPLQQLKTHWQMCTTCGILIFGLKLKNAKFSILWLVWFFAQETGFQLSII